MTTITSQHITSLLLQYERLRLDTNMPMKALGFLTDMRRLGGLNTESACALVRFRLLSFTCFEGRRRRTERLGSAARRVVNLNLLL